MIAKADVHLDGNDCRRELASQGDANPLVFALLMDRRSLKCRGIEDNTIYGFVNPANACEQPSDGGGIRTAFAEEIEIARGPKEVLGPRQEEHDSLEDVSLGGFRHAQSVQETLDGVPCQDALEIIAVASGVVQQALADRGTVIPEDSVRHCSALRYGRIRSATRSISA